MMLISVVQIYKDPGCKYLLRLSLLSGSQYFSLNKEAVYTFPTHQQTPITLPGVIAEYDNTETSGLILDAEVNESYLFLQV